MFPRDFYRDGIYEILDVRGYRKALNINYGKLIGGGQRGTALLGTPNTAAGTLVYSDIDGDGLFETATVTLTNQTITDVCEAKVYFAGMDGIQEWEIRPPRSKTLSIAGTLTIVFDSWLFINPDLLSAFPTDAGFVAVDLSNTTPLVTSVEVYQEYSSISDPSCIFKWENDSFECTRCGGSGCIACSATEQDGCIQVRDPEAGIIVPVPATYTSGSWEASSFSVCRAPDRVELYYLAGDRSQEFLRGTSCDPLSDQWAWCIIWIAISRLERPPCSCNRLKDMFDYLREDLSHSEASGSYFLGTELGANPFGSHRGEWMAWKRVKHTMGRKMSVAVI
jgi:hypothetical protein